MNRMSAQQQILLKQPFMIHIDFQHFIFESQGISWNKPLWTEVWMFHITGWNRQSNTGPSTHLTEVDTCADCL